MPADEKTFCFNFSISQAVAGERIARKDCGQAGHGVMFSLCDLMGRCKGS